MNDETTNTGTHPEWKPLEENEKKSKKNARRILENTPFFQNLGRNDWRELEALFHERHYETDEVIFYEGTPGLGMYVIVDGAVRVVSEQDGEEVQYASLESGDFFGELSLVEEEQPRSASAIAQGPTRLIGLFRPQLLALMHTRPKLGVVLLERLARNIAARLREANQLLEKLEIKEG